MSLCVYGRIEGKIFNEKSRQTFDFIESLKKTSQFSCLYINKAANIYEELPNTFDSFCRLLKSNVNQENGQIFEDLGYYIFFVTKKDEAVNFSVDLHSGLIFGKKKSLMVC